jgi:ABC-type branched-subunit amino acid transport system substrate-binding protein
MLFRPIVSLAITALLILVLAASVFPMGCAPSLPPEPEWEKEARVALDQAESLLYRKQYDQAAKALEAFFMKYPKSRHRDRALHAMGDIRLTQRDYRQALAYYKEILEKYPSSPFIADSKYKLGRCFFELKEYDLAVANLEDRSKITDPGQLQSIAEMLSFSYVARKNYLPAAKEFAYLVEHGQNPKQQAGYRDRVRELVEKNLTEDELRSLGGGNAYPADLALLRLAALLVEQRKYRDAIGILENFNQRFPAHPEKTRADMLLNQATIGMTAPRYSVGVIVPQSGQLAFFGERVLKGVQLAVHEHNLQDPENRVELVVKDTEGSPEKAVAALTELVAKGVVAAIGPVTTREEETLAPVLESLRIPVIRPAASRAGFSFRSAWIFRNALTIDSQATAAAQYALGMKLQRFVKMYPDEPYGKDLFQLFSRELEKKAEAIGNVAYPPDTKDFGPFIRKIMEIDLRSRKIVIPEDEAERKKLFAEYVPGFDALYLPGYAEQVGLLIPQLAFYNITGIPMIGSDNWHSQELIDRAGRHAEGAVFVDGFFPESKDPAVQRFVESYRSAYQQEPDILAAQAFDSAMMIFSLLKERKDTPQAIREGLLAIKEYPGITGLTAFDGSQEARKKLFLIKIEDGQFTALNAEQ